MSLAPGLGADSGSQEGGRYETVSALTNQGLACADRGQPSCTEASCADRLAHHDRTQGVKTPLKEARHSS